FLTPQGETVCVLTNEGPERKISLEVQGNKMNIVTTTQSRQLENTYSGEIKSDITLPENSITTLILSE
ncbi:MAG: glycoside hydrolase family 30 beta sandwich domain-containing protein, partial [Acutalibacteraceae bacterium]